MPEQFISEHNGKVYLAARAHIVSDPSELREMAFALKDGDALNPDFMWISGRYVQGDKPNRNGQFWTSEDLKQGEYSLKYAPLNALHEYLNPVGVFVETKIVHREKAGETLLPEIQALSLLWAHNFPELAETAREANKKGQLWYSMECVGEAKQCLTCDETFEWAATTLCSHLEASAVAPRRLINPKFQGGALIFPPVSPGWIDADIEEVAKATVAFAGRETSKVLSDEDRALQHLFTQVITPA